MPHDRQPRVHATETGFTLIEMIIVLAVISVLVTLVMPRLDLQTFQAESAMQGVGSMLLGAQRSAVTKQHDVIVTFDIGTNAISIHDDADNDGTVDTGERNLRHPIGDNIVFGLGGAPVHPIGSNPVNFTKLVGGRPALVFHRNGSASEASGFYLTTLRAVNSGGKPDDTRAIQIERSTGRASWFHYTGSKWERGF